MPDFIQITCHEFARSDIRNPVNSITEIALCPHIKTDARFKVQFADNHLGKIISFLTNLANNFKKVLIKKIPGAVTCCQNCSNATIEMFPSNY